MTTSEMTVGEMTESLTGFDEIAIERHLDLDPYLGGQTKPMLLMRALVFVDQRRKGSTDAEAKQYAMELPMGSLNGYFAEDDEVDTEDPVTESGKDD